MKKNRYCTTTRKLMKIFQGLFLYRCTVISNDASHYFIYTDMDVEGQVKVKVKTDINPAQCLSPPPITEKNDRNAMKKNLNFTIFAYKLIPMTVNY